MNDFEINELFSEKTITNITLKWKGLTKDDFKENDEDLNSDEFIEERQDDYINENLGNSILSILNELKEINK